MKQFPYPFSLCDDEEIVKINIFLKIKEVNDPYKKIAKAVIQGKGCRLNTEELHKLVLVDEAFSQAIVNKVLEL